MSYVYDRLDCLLKFNVGYYFVNILYPVGVIYRLKVSEPGLWCSPIIIISFGLRSWNADKLTILG